MLVLLGLVWLSFVDPAKLSEYELRMAADDANARGQHRRCAELYRQAVELDPKRARWNAYDMACCLALAGDAPAALTALRRAVELGYPLAAHLEADSDLDSLRRHPEWKGVVVGAETNEAAYRRTINRHLYRHYVDDQTARLRPSRGLRRPTVIAMEDRRRRAVAQILLRGGATVSDDFYHAAMVFQHGRTPEDFQRAHELAVRAVELDSSNDRARWLAAAAKDRALVSRRLPQLYGTQYRHLPDGTMNLYPVDPTIGDDERRKWNVMPLANMQLMVVRHNRQLRNNPASNRP